MTIKQLLFGMTRTPAVKSRFNALRGCCEYLLEGTESEAYELLAGAIQLRREWIAELRKFLSGKTELSDFNMKEFRSAEAKSGKDLNPYAWVEDVLIPKYESEIREYSDAESSIRWLVKRAKTEKAKRLEE